MCKRFLAGLLVLGWISLSGVDVLEDLSNALKHDHITKAADNFGSRTARAVGELANDLVEWANETNTTSLASADLRVLVSRSELTAEFHKHSPLHKLFKVFLI